MSKYGNLPKIVGECFGVSNDESMLYLYAPISLKGSGNVYLEGHMEKFYSLLGYVKADLGEETWADSYIYLTIKSMFVSGASTGQRPGWHCDGFMTDDVNYIWSDSESTVIYCGPKIDLSQNHQESMSEMEYLCSEQLHGKTYGNNLLMKLDESVIHKARDFVEPGFRNFVKISVSQHRYALKGNTKNYHPEIYKETIGWTYEDRFTDRNCPTGDS